jgi:uncharacterized glyoxalase superfamily protein PhnB
VTLPDAFDAMRADTSPIAPSPVFSTRLRAQLTTRTEPTMTLTTITPYLVVHDAAAAIDFYVAAFGGVEHHRLVGDDGRIGHAEIVIGNSRIMLADEYPEAGAISPMTRGGTSTSFTCAVTDVDAAFATAIALGATELRPVSDQFYGHRQGTFRDPFGHHWSVTSPIAGFDDATYAANSREQGFEVQTGPASGADLHQVKHFDRGDLFYFTLPAVDLARAQAFFSAVLGWQFEDAGNGHVSNIAAPTGGLYHDGPDEITLWFVVDDIHAAVAAVREHGGQAEEPAENDSGWDAACTDDQGTRFHLSVPAAKYSLP